MDQFARQHSLTRYGAVLKLPDGKTIMNASLHGGHDFILWGTDFDLLVVSDPYRPKATQFTLVHRDKVPTKAQWAIAHQFLDRVRPFTSPANGTLHEPSCSQVPTQTPR
jgi:hypothetical protein